MPGETNRVMPQGNLIYIKAANGNFYPALGNTAGYQLIGQREYFEFRPGSQPLESIAGSTTAGAVPSGVRTGAATTTSGTAAASTYWGSWLNYSPLRTGYIDGKTSGGIIEGQVTVGMLLSAGATTTITPLLQMANTANTVAPTTILLAGTAVTCSSTAYTYSTYDINYLETNTVLNSVPFSLRMGVQLTGGAAGTTTTFRIMESSAIRGYYEPTS